MKRIDRYRGSLGQSALLVCTILSGIEGCKGDGNVTRPTSQPPTKIKDNISDSKLKKELEIAGEFREKLEALQFQFFSLTVSGDGQTATINIGFNRSLLPLYNHLCSPEGIKKIDGLKSLAGQKLIAQETRGKATVFILQEDSCHQENAPQYEKNRKETGTTCPNDGITPELHVFHNETANQGEGSLCLKSEVQEQTLCLPLFNPKVFLPPATDGSYRLMSLPVPIANRLSDTQQAIQNGNNEACEELNAIFEQIDELNTRRLNSKGIYYEPEPRVE